MCTCIYRLTDLVIAVSNEDFVEQSAPIVAIVPLAASNDDANTLKANGSIDYRFDASIDTHIIV
jgi:hypothetical protein